MRLIPVLAMLLGVIGVSGGMDVKISFPLEDRDNSGVDFTSKKIKGDDDYIKVKLTQGSIFTVSLDDDYRDYGKWFLVNPDGNCLVFQTRDTGEERFGKNVSANVVYYRFIAKADCAKTLQFVRIQRNLEWGVGATDAHMTILVKAEVE